jgi:hypothetical protein
MVCSVVVMVSVAVGIVRIRSVHPCQVRTGLTMWLVAAMVSVAVSTVNLVNVQQCLQQIGRIMCLVAVIVSVVADTVVGGSVKQNQTVIVVYSVMVVVEGQPAIPVQVIMENGQVVNIQSMVVVQTVFRKRLQTKVVQ